MYLKRRNNMEYIGKLFDFLQRLIVWWITIMPWEKAVHVRLGKRVKILSAGIHLRIPLIDCVYVQTTRMRVVQLPPQTVTTKDGKIITISMNMGYTIVDILILYQTLYHADQTIGNIIQGVVADEIYKRDLIQCIPKELEIAVQSNIDGVDYGLEFKYINITGFAVVKTYRLIQDGYWSQINNELQTDKQTK
jgi:regulator of protease activity HflC (stomatin/prohibitin superfamily)